MSERADRAARALDYVFDGKNDLSFEDDLSEVASEPVERPLLTEIDFE